MINIKFKMKITIAIIAILVLLSVSAFRTKNTLESKVKQNWNVYCNDPIQYMRINESYCYNCESYAVGEALMYGCAECVDWTNC